MSSNHLVPIDDLGFFDATDTPSPLSWTTSFPELCTVSNSSSPTYPTYPTFSEVYDSFPFLIDPPVRVPLTTSAQTDDNREEMGSTAETVPPPVTVQKTKRLKVRDRFKLLQNDPFLLSFGETSVICGGCGKTIKLESRNGARYYPTLWLKHKSYCFGDQVDMTAGYREKGTRKRRTKSGSGL